MILFIVGLLLCIGLIGLGIWGAKNSNEVAQVLGWVFGVILGLVFVLTSIMVPIGNQIRLQEMVAFQEANIANYATAVESSTAILSEQKFIESALIPVEGSVEKIQFADTVGDFIKDWRDSVVDYNNDLQVFRHFYNDPVLGYYYPEPPEELRLLQIK